MKSANDNRVSSRSSANDAVSARLPLATHGLTGAPPGDFGEGATGVFGKSVTEDFGEGVTGDFGQSVTDFEFAPKGRSGTGSGSAARVVRCFLRARLAGFATGERDAPEEP
jgi:hypothetical protein